MKIKQYLAGSLLALMALTTACTNEEIVGNGGTGSNGELPEGAVQFKIDGINTGAVQTRAIGGTVVASAQENRVDNLTILVFGSEKEGAKPEELIFQDYWTSNKRADYICDTDNKTFALKGMGRYYTATIVVPVELKTVQYCFLTNEPRLFDAAPLVEAVTAGGNSFTLTEFKKMYAKEGDHLHVGYPLTGRDFVEACATLAMTEAVEGVGVPAGSAYTVPVKFPCDKVPFEMENDYFGFVDGQRETLAMFGVSEEHVAPSDGREMSVTLYRNVARLDVSSDNISVKELKLTNIGAMGTYGDGGAIESIPFDFAKVADDDFVQSTFSLVKTDADGNVVIPARSYCYPSVGKVKLVGTLADGTAFEIPFVDKDTQEQLEVKNNHRYVIRLRQTTDHHIDANIIVEDWNVGDEIDVDLNGGDAVTPAPALYAESNYDRVTWEGTGKVIAMVSDNYSLNSTNPGTYPWLRFDLGQMSSLGLKMYYKDEEAAYPGAFFDPTMKVYNTTESADGTKVRHELMITRPTLSTQWLKLQNNFDPALNYIVKIETGNMEATGTNTKTPALIAFAETNVTGGADLVAFPAGGFDGPYAQPVADWSAFRGTEETTTTVAGYSMPTAEQLQCITPDAGYGYFENYNGSDVIKKFISNNVTVYYSGSPLDRNVVKVVVDRTQTGDELGTAAAYVNVEATLWHYEAGKYLRINTVNMAIPGSNVERLTSYTALTDLFNNGRDISDGITRFFPESANAETAYLGEEGSALVFSARGVKFTAAYAGTGYIRPVMNNGVMKMPARKPVAIDAYTSPKVNGRTAFISGDWYVVSGTPKKEDDKTYTTLWETAEAAMPIGWVMPDKAFADKLAGIALTDTRATVAVAEFFTLFPDNSATDAPDGTKYWLSDADGTDNVYCIEVKGTEAAVHSVVKADAQAAVRYIQNYK